MCLTNLREKNYIDSICVFIGSSKCVYYNYTCTLKHFASSMILLELFSFWIIKRGSIPSNLSSFSLKYFQESGIYKKVQGVSYLK